MEIPLNAKVECTDGVCGTSEYVLINPVTSRVTHLVVKEDSSPYTEYIVPLDLLTETIVDTIQLHCTKAKLRKMKPFIKTTFIEEKLPDMNFGYPGGSFGAGSYFYMPYVTAENTVKVPVTHMQIPHGELTVQRGTRVEATDGYVGNVDEFVVDPENGHITYLVMREGHLWGQKDVLIPLSAMGDTREDTVFLEIDKSQIASLPTFPVHRLWS